MRQISDKFWLSCCLRKYLWIKTSIRHSVNSSEPITPSVINKLIWVQYHTPQKVHASFKCSDVDSTYYGAAIIKKLLTLFLESSLPTVWLQSWMSVMNFYYLISEFILFGSSNISCSIRSSDRLVSSNIAPLLLNCCLPLSHILKVALVRVKMLAAKQFCIIFYWMALKFTSSNLE